MAHKPGNTKFHQQELAAWQPLLTPSTSIFVYFFFGVATLVLGGAIVRESSKFVELSQRYDHLTECNPPNASPPYYNCTILFHVTQDISAPVYFYYEVYNFFQNHHHYVYSKDDNQLRGIELENEATNPLCDPLQTWNGTSLYPCGLIANSYFNDTYSAQLCRTDSNCTAFVRGENWHENDIAWESDKSVKFKEFNPPVKTTVGPNGFRLPNITDEHFIVWMRLAALPNFKKLYARIDTPLYKGDVLNISIANAWPVSMFDGEKHVLISNTNKALSSFLGYISLALGVICILSGTLFTCYWKTHPRKLGDFSQFGD